MEYIRIALAANLNRAADTLERLARGAEAEPTSTEQLEEMQAQVDAGAAVWGAVLHGLLKVPEIVEHVDELTASGYTEPDSLVGSGQESANLFLSVMTDFVYPLGEATTPTYSLCDRWEPSDDHHVMYRRNELRSESTGCRLLARLIEGTELTVGARGRPSKAELHQRIRQLYSENNLVHNSRKWARLEMIVNADDEAMRLNGGNPISRDAAKDAVRQKRKK